MPESGTATTEPVEQPAAMAEAAAHGAAGEHAAHSGGHRFNFVELNQSHAYPYPAIAWGHGKPQLILNLPGYAAHSFAHLSEDPAFATVVARASTWPGPRTTPRPTPAATARPPPSWPRR